ncbi:MAG: Cytochrome [Micavibrio sp.]|nr:Cytochrome [Micavibrio sp.]
MRLQTILLSLVFFCAAPALAATATPAAPSNWTIVRDASTLGFEGVQMGAPFQGHFSSFDGIIAFDPDNLPASKADITIETGSVDAGSDDRNKSLPSKDWFNTDSFPEAHFVTRSITMGLDQNQYVARGDLTIRNVTLPITLPFTLVITKSDSGESFAKMNGEAVINRLDYGVGQGEWTDTKSVENQVKIKVSLTAKSKQGTK